jgi:hypothetical protein
MSQIKVLGWRAGKRGDGIEVWRYSYAVILLYSDTIIE